MSDRYQIYFLIFVFVMLPILRWILSKLAKSVQPQQRPPRRPAVSPQTTGKTEPPWNNIWIEEEAEVAPPTPRPVPASQVRTGTAPRLRVQA